MSMLVSDRLMSVEPAPGRHCRQCAGVTVLGRDEPHHVVAGPRLAPDVGVSRPGIFTSGLSQNRARDSRLTRLPSGKHTGHTEPPVNEEMRALPCQLL